MFSPLKTANRMAVWLAAVLIGPPAAGDVTLVTPDWKITLTDFGYSDLLLDNTPVFRGREYLSGEWGAAVGYQVGESAPVSPKWLEPDFIYPDWTTNSDFVVTTPAREIGVNRDGLPIAESVIQNADLEITLRFEVVDTVLGTPMGNMADSLGGGGDFLRSNRYVLKQTYTLKNISGSGISGLQFFQLVHSLNGERGYFDQRVYPGPFSSSHYDVTLSGLDPWSVGVPSAPEGLEDFVGFHGAVAPSAHEIGYYGIKGNGIDNHVSGKPSDGVHLSIEANWLTLPYSGREGRDSFEPEEKWVAGAQRWDLADLAAGGETSHEVILSLRTGTPVGRTGVSGGCGGGANYQGGMDFAFEAVTKAGLCFSQATKADWRQVQVFIENGEMTEPDFPALGGLAQIWTTDFTGQHEGSVDLTFAYDSSLVPESFDPSRICIYQYDGGAWRQLPSTVDPARSKIRVTTSDLTLYALGSTGVAGHAVVTSSLPAAAGAVTGSGTYVAGASVTVVAAAGEGYVFENWTENGVVVAGSPSHTFVLGEDHDLQANFVPVGEGLGISTRSLPSMGGQTTGDGVYQTGAEVAVAATVNPGYRFDGWLVNGVRVSDSPEYVFTAGSSVALTAAFSRVFTINAIAEPQQGGEIMYVGEYDPDQIAVLTAEANPGYVFSEWTLNGMLVSSEPTLRYAVTGDRTLVANFVPLVDITVRASAPQAGICSGGGRVTQGSVMNVFAVASPGFVFLHWTVDGAIVAETPEYVFEANTSEELIAVFEPIPNLSLAVPSDDVLTLVWPETSAGWILQESQNLSSDWIDSPRTVEVVDGMNHVVITGLSGRGFFRLRRP